MTRLQENEIFGLVKTDIDVHTLGMITIAHLLRDCGYECYISPSEISVAVENIHKLNNFSLLQKWISDNHITRIGFSYRLDPHEAKDYFCHLFYEIKNHNLFVENGGCLREVFFAGLPDACLLVKRELGDQILVFPGDETPMESLQKLGVPESKFPKDLKLNSEYDNMRWSFATKLIESESYRCVKQQEHLGYPDAGTDSDSFIKRVAYCKKRQSLPLIRAHVGPYSSNRLEAIKEFISWEKELAKSGFLDVLSIGSSQLTQSRFGEDWDGLPNGGGVPVNSEQEYRMIKEAASPMLVRTYAGTKNVPNMAKMHERCLNISWHALSFWWFCEIDGRGSNSVLENLKEHLETIKYIASTGKPFEPNVPHHFAFRGADDISYIISGYLAAKTAKRLGIKDLILQNMLNTPKYTIGLQDLAKGRVMLRLVRELEDGNFRVHLQSRAGLDYFSPDLEKAKIQLAAVTALMDDIEPDNMNSPEIIHVVSYSEAVRLATPPVINESIQITLAALEKYRRLRNTGQIENMAHNQDLNERTEDMYQEAKEAIDVLEKYIVNLYTAEGLYKVFKEGFLPVPYMIDSYNKYKEATMWNTAIKNGGIRVVDEKGEIIRTSARYRKIISCHE
ncbi:hypothetical protein [Bacteroides fluxus]|uniref:hypothetical protein n=1 Tax=Bacteroides fluxus TaxID=626930 RepID=UPI00267296F4|nr:hypothetical protein [Bacteroides fluxus]